MMESTGALRAEVLDTRRRTRWIHLTVPAGDPGVRPTITDRGNHERITQTADERMGT